MADNDALKGLAVGFIGFLLCDIAITGRFGSLLGAVIDPANLVTGTFPFNQSTNGNSTGGNSGTSNLPTGGTLTPVQIATYAKNAGFSGQGLIYAIAICLAESGGQVGIINKSDKTDYGLWQINIKAHPQYTPARLLSDPAYNASAAYQISSGGKNWNPWTTFTNGAYNNYISTAVKAAAQINALPQES